MLDNEPLINARMCAPGSFSVRKPRRDEGRLPPALRNVDHRGGKPLSDPGAAALAFWRWT